MLILAIDTALTACSLAIVRNGETLVSRVEPMARGQAERLAPMVHDAVAEAAISFGALDRIAVTRGPGAFTGLRVGLAFARGLAVALDKPCVGLSTLKVLATAVNGLRVIAAISVAGSLFVGAWEGGHEVIAPCKIDIETLLNQLEGRWAVTGSGATDILTARPDWEHVIQTTPDPVVLAYLAAQADPATHLPVPLYLRGVDAKLPGGLYLPNATL